MTAASSPTVRQVLERLTRDELVAAVDLYGIEVADRQAKAALADALSRSPQADLVDALGRLSRDRLKQLCRDLSLDDSGREKATLVERLLPRQVKPNGHAGQLIVSRWLCYALNSRVGRYQVELVQYGAAQEQFNISHAANWLFPVPPREEQLRIADELDEQCGRIQELVARTATSLDKLREYRRALITAAVTGKLDVTKEPPS